MAMPRMTLSWRKFEVGQDTREDVAEKVGRPGVSGVMEGGAWYYVQSDWVERLARPGRSEARGRGNQLRRSDRVANIERYGLDDGRVVALSRRITDTGPSGQSVLSQLFSNFGQFNPAQMLGG